MAFGDGPTAFGAGIDVFNRSTDRFTPSQREALGQRGLFGFLPETDLSIGGTANQVLQGFVSGFTGFNYGDDPENSVEAIARSIGGVAGFLGFVPGAGLAGKLGARGVAKAFGATRLAEKLSGPAFHTVRSVPLLVADATIDAASRIGKNNAFLSSVKFLSNSRVADTITEGARLGIASGFAAPWTEGVGEIALQTGLGVIDGAGFNLINSQIRKYFKGALSSSSEKTKLAAEGAVRGIANAMFNGLQGNIFNPDAPLEMEVFDYLLGFGFGVIDKPYELRKAMEFMRRRTRVDLMNLERLPDFQNLDPKVQQELMYQRELLVGKSLNTQGDTEAGGVMAEAHRQLYQEYYNQKAEELSAQGLSESEVFEQANKFAEAESGLPFWRAQQEQSWGRLGDEVVSFFDVQTEGNRPELHIGPMPGGDTTQPIRFDRDSNRLFLDDEILKRKFNEQDEFSSRRDFMRYELLKEYHSKTSADDVDADAIARADLEVLRVASGDANKPQEDQVRPEDVDQQKETYQSSLGEERTLDPEATRIIRGSSISSDQLARATNERRQAIEDHDVPSILVRPIDSFVESLRRSVEGSDKAEIRRTVFRAFGRRVPGEDGTERRTTWLEALADIYDDLGLKEIDENSPQVRDLRRSWKLYEQNRAVRQGYWSRGGISLYGTDGLGREDAAGNDIVKSKAPTHLDSTIKKLGMDEGFFVEKEESGRSVEGIFEDNDFDTISYILRSYQDNTPFVAGTKDKGRNHHTSGFAFEKAEAPRLFREKLAAIARVEADLKSKGTKGVRNVEIDIEALFQEFIESVRERNGRIADPDDKFIGEIIDDRDPFLREAWESLWLNNVRILEEANGGIPLEKMIEANLTGKGQFVLTPHGLNKRMQILDDGSPVADPSFYPEETQDLGGLRAVVVRAKGFTGEGVKDILLKRYGKGGSIEDYIADHHLDGVVFERQDVFDARLKDIGGDSEAGVIKGSTIFADGDGMFIGKMAIFRAPDEMNPELERHGLHQMYMDSATKQRGMRSEYNARIRKDGTLQFENPATKTHRAIKPENVRTFIVPFEGQRMNLSVGESPRKSLKNQNAPVQLHTTIDDPAAREAWVRNYVEPAYRGEAAENLKLQKALRKGGDPSSINWNKVGIDEILDLYTAHQEDVMLDSPAYRAMIDHVMKKAADNPEGLDPDNVEADFEELQAIQDFSSAADRILSLWPLTPATTRLEFVQPFIDAALRNYVMNRVMRPEIPYSGKVIAGPADPILRKKLDIKPGFVYLDESWKRKKIRWIGGEETTLENAYAEYQSSSGTTKEMMGKLLSFATIRVPADSASGVRMLEFGGFTGRRGAGGTVHNEEMINLGGMDLDIDSFFIFQDLDNAQQNPAQPIRSFFESKRDQWVDQNGVIVDSKPESNDPLWVDQLKDFQRHPAAAFDPMLRMSSSAGAYRGNRMLGIGAVAGRRGDAWLNAALAGDDRARRVVLNGWMYDELQAAAQDALPVPPNATFEIMINPTDDRRAFDEVRREAMNRSADAGDYPGFKQNKFTVGGLITKNLVGSYSVRATFKVGKGDNAREVVREFPIDRLEDPDMFKVAPSKTQLWGMMSRADSHAKGRDYGDRMTASKAWEILRRTEGYEDLGRIPKELDDDTIDYTPDELGELLQGRVSAKVGMDVPGDGIASTLEKAKRERGRYTLGRSMHTLSSMADDLELQSTYYQSLAMIGRSPFTDRSDDTSFVNIRGWRNLARLFNQVYNEDTPGAAEARKAIGRETLTVSEFGDLPDAEIPGWAVKQDIADITSASIVKEAVDWAMSQGVTEHRIGDITVRVEGLKNQYKMALDRKPIEEGTEPQTTEEVSAEIDEFVSGLSVPEKKVFDIYMMGSIFRQEKKLKTLKNRIWEEGKEKGWSKEAIDNRMRAEVKEWYKTNFQRLGFQLEAVDPISVKEFGEAYNRVVQATLKDDLSDNDVREILGRAKLFEAPALEKELEGASTLNEAPEIEEWSDSFLERAFGIASDAQNEGVLGRPENQRRIRELKEILRTNPNLRHHFSEFFATTIANNSAEGVGVVPSRATLADLDAFVRVMKDMNEGRTLTNVLKGDPVPKAAYFMFPETWASMLDPFDAQPHKVVKKILTEQGPKTVETYEFNSTARDVLRIMGQAVDAKDAEMPEVTKRISQRFGYLFTAAGPDATPMFEAVVARLELDAEQGRKKKNKSRIAVLEAEWERHESAYNSFLDKDYDLSVKGKLQKAKGKEIMYQIRRKIEEHTAEDFNRYVRNDEMVNKFFVYRPGGSVHVLKTLEKIDRELQRTGKLPVLGVEPIYRLIFELKAYHKQVEIPSHAIDGTEGVTTLSMRDAERANMGEEVVSLIRSRIEQDTPFRGVGEVKFGYFPHGNYPQRVVKEHLKKKLQQMTAEGATEEDKRRAESMIRRAYADGTLNDEDLTGAISDIIMGSEATVRSLENGDLEWRPGNTLGRSDDPIPGWDKTPKALEDYGHKMARAYHMMLGSLLADRRIKRFEVDEVMGETTDSWARFLRMYVSRSVGNPSVFPKEYLMDKNLNLKNSVYWYFTDQALEEGFRKVDRKFFGNRFFKGDSAGVGGPDSKRFQRKAAWFSGLDAKWNMLALLARTKGYVNNLSQSLNTAISAGFNPARKALSMRWITSNILDKDGNPVFRGRDDIKRFVEASGGVESFIVDEAGLRGKVDPTRLAAFTNEATELIRAKYRKGEVDEKALDRTLLEIANKYGISEAIMNAGGWFMRASERALRIHSFMSHYIKAREVLAVNGFTHAYDDPHLVEMARRGTEATQFMYNNAARPAFAASHFGKIVARFQLWTWNSIKFRRDIYRQARAWGFREGTPEFERYRRMATLDTLGFALAAIFPASFFESTLPQPLGYLNDLAQFFFGQDREEREKAFFGALPYPFNVTQMVLPPSSRALTMWVTPLMTGDWDRFLEYHIWTLAPFGLMMRDATMTLKNPIRAVDQLTGFPLIRVHQESKNRKLEPPPSFFDTED